MNHIFELADRASHEGDDHALGELERLLERMSTPDLLRIAGAAALLARLANTTGDIVMRSPAELPPGQENLEHP